MNKAYINPVVAAWNLGLSLFSFWGLYWTAPHLYSFLMAPEHGFRATVCYSAQWYGHGYCGKAMAFFIYSKLFELFDTLWLILKKRPVIFLHSYHHITVLLYCWHSYASRISSGLWFGTMNYFVHSLMCKSTVSHLTSNSRRNLHVVAVADCVVLSALARCGIHLFQISTTS